jgi:hypothetical protein
MVAFEIDSVTRALAASERMTCPSRDEMLERVGLHVKLPEAFLTSELPRSGKWTQKSSRFRLGGTRTVAAEP